jgi:hypothetical protein
MKRPVSDRKKCLLALNHFDTIMKPNLNKRAIMASITVKNIPQALYEKLKIVGSMNRRSINNEMIICLESVIMTKDCQLAKNWHGPKGYVPALVQKKLIPMKLKRPWRKAGNDNC